MREGGCESHAEWGRVIEEEEILHNWILPWCWRCPTDLPFTCYHFIPLCLAEVLPPWNLYCNGRNQLDSHRAVFHLAPLPNYIRRLILQRWMHNEFHKYGSFGSLTLLSSLPISPWIYHPPPLYMSQQSSFFPSLHPSLLPCNLRGNTVRKSPRSSDPPLNLCLLWQIVATWAFHFILQKRGSLSPLFNASCLSVQMAGSKKIKSGAINATWYVYMVCVCVFVHLGIWLLRVCAGGPVGEIRVAVLEIRGARKEAARDERCRGRL